MTTALVVGAGLSGIACAKNHAWIGVSSTAPATAPCSARTSAAVPATRASPATVGCSKSCRGVTCTPARRARETTCSDRMLSPPSSKKFSSTPTRSRRSTAAHASASTRSVSVRGPTYPRSASALRSGAGSARRSTFPTRLILPSHTHARLDHLCFSIYRYTSL